MDGGAWWAAVYGVAQSWTRQKRNANSIFESLWHYYVRSLRDNVRGHLY